MSRGSWTNCFQCKEPIWLDEGREEMLRRSSQSFYCLWGHRQHFTQGPSEADKLRLERNRLAQENARLEEYRLASERAEHAALAHARHQAARAAAFKGQVTKLKTRAAAGVCPCCNRTFTNLQRHMASKHAGFVAEEVAPEGATLQ